MKEKIPPYIKYTKDSDHFSDYFTYQNKYRQSIRESDSVIINIIEKLSEDDDSNKTLIDIGCSTGNLLSHINNRFPNYQLHGADLVESSWEESGWVPEDPAGVMIETCLDAGRPLAYIPEEHRAWYQSLDYFVINGIIHDYRGLRIRDSWIRNGLKSLNIKPVFTHNI